MMKYTLSCLALCFSASVWAQNSNPVISYLEIFDVASGTHRVVKEFPFTIEAPNWTPDGKWLVVNKGGQLYKIATDGSTDLQLIPSGSIKRCNNDHVISADGKWIGFSSADPSEPRYNSYVYVMPFEGGEPRRLTPIGPSYLHGISPDFKTVAYCAFRGEQHEQDVWTMPIKGGNETRLTTTTGLDDGPEYSRDGKNIWFNSVRSGRMQVWRMKPNGKEQTQMTFDTDMNSWFPHISPDGKQVVYIAYHDYEVEPGVHIANQNVQLRMIPAKGGEPTVLEELFGGQGTINVNSWSPDSKQFAYVSYRLQDEINAPQKDFSLQLYSLHALIGTPDKFAKNHDYVLTRVRQMGYTGVELYTYNNGKISGMDPAAFAAEVKKYDLKITSSHVRHYLTDAEYASGDFSKELSWWDTCIADHKAAGINTIIFPNDKKVQTPAQIKVLAQYLNAVGERCKAAGIRLGFHNDIQEYGTMDDKTTKMDYLIQNTDQDKVFFELDTYWTVRAGVSPVQMLQKYPGRYALVHISDQAEIGQSGMVGFEPIFKAFAKAGTQGFVVDMDHTSTANVLKGVRESALYLRHADYVQASYLPK